jgi:hypothetical protein
VKSVIIVIDGMGGGIGAQIISKIRESQGSTGGVTPEIIALGTNAGATERMLKAGADRGATGENAIRVNASRAAFIMGPIGIVIPNSIMGEVTASMAEAVMASPAERILIPLEQDHFHLPGVQALPLSKLVEKAADYLLAAL